MVHVRLDNPEAQCAESSFQIQLAGAVHDVDVIMVHVGLDNPEAQCAGSSFQIRL